MGMSFLRPKVMAVRYAEWCAESAAACLLKLILTTAMGDAS